MKRIVVVLPNWYGETLFATPFLRALRQSCPQAFIAALGRSAGREILAHNPHLSAFIEYDEQGRHRGILGRARIISQLYRYRFDGSFILRRSLSRTLMMAAAGIGVRVGHENVKSGWALTHRAAAATLPIHKAATYLPLLEAVGLPPITGSYEYVVSQTEREGAAAWLCSTPALDGRPIAVLHPGANWPHKRWSPERFGALGERLFREQGLGIVVTGGPEDQGVAQRVAKRVQGEVTVLAGRTTLRQLAACLELARLVVSNDTGVLHIAAAIRRPVLALYGPTSPVLTGPLGDPDRTVVLHHPDCCPQIPCYNPDHPAYPGMDAISVEEAHEAAVQLLRNG